MAHTAVLCAYRRGVLDLNFTFDINFVFIPLFLLVILFRLWLGLDWIANRIKKKWHLNINDKIIFILVKILMCVEDIPKNLIRLFNILMKQNMLYFPAWRLSVSQKANPWSLPWVLLVKKGTNWKSQISTKFWMVINPYGFHHQ